MADDGTVDDEGHDNFYYVLNNVIKGNHLPCPKSVTPLLPELPEVLIVSWLDLCRQIECTCLHALPVSLSNATGPV